MKYAICRIEKFKSMEKVTSAGDHINRLRETPNADPARPITVLHGSSDLASDVRARLPKKTRSNAVYAVGMLLSASSEWFREGGRVEDWCDSCLAWLECRYGKNCVNVTLHEDELVPHLHAYIVPITAKGRLSCDEFFGTPQKLSKLQDDYADSMQHLGLQRGIPRTQTKRRHQHVRRFYEMCNQVESRLDVGQIVAKLHQATTPTRETSSRITSQF